MANELRRKSQIAWGMCVICVLFLLETWNADRLMPNPASPLIWALLGSGAVVFLLLALWLGNRASRTQKTE